jgi:hypothetical protein
MADPGGMGRDGDARAASHIGAVAVTPAHDSATPPVDAGDVLPPESAPPGNHDRRRDRAGFIVVAVLAALALAWLTLVFVSFRETQVVDGQTVFVVGDMWGYDYEAYLNAARRLADTGTPYQSETLGGPYRPGPYGLYMYSPVLAVSLLPVTGLSVEDSSAIWYLAHVLALLSACAIMPVRPRLQMATFAAAAFSFALVKDMSLGNVSVLLLLPMAMTWRWLDRPVGSLALAAALWVRPVLGIVLLWQLLRRQWWAVAWTISAGLVLVLVTLPFIGVSGYVDYLTVLGNMSGVTGVPRNHDISSTLLDMGATEETASLGLLAGYAIAIGATMLSLRRDRDLGFMVAVTASLLLSPLLWDHYLALLVLPAAFLAQRWSPLALALPLLSWLPPGSYPAVVLAALGLLLLAPAPTPPDKDDLRAGNRQASRPAFA